MMYRARLSNDGTIVMDKMDNMYYNNCLRCGRKLKSDESRQRGYGDICYEKSKIAENCQKMQLF